MWCDVVRRMHGDGEEVYWRGVMVDGGWWMVRRCEDEEEELRDF